MRKWFSALCVDPAAKKEMLIFMSAAAFQGGLLYTAIEEASATEKAFRALPIQEQEKIYNRDPANKVRTTCDFWGAWSLHMLRTNPASHEHMAPLIPFQKVRR